MAEETSWTEERLEKLKNCGTLACPFHKLVNSWE